MTNEAAYSSVAIATESIASIPVIDFAPFFNTDISTRQKIAAEIHRAFKEIGFLYFKNSGVPQALVNQIFNQ